VDVDTFRLTIQDAFSATQSFQLSSGSSIQVGIRAPQFPFNLLANDILQLQANLYLATSSEDTFLTFTNGMITDTSGNPVVAAIDGANPVQVDQYTRDSINPSLAAFRRLDMNLEFIQLAIGISNSVFFI